ncbi:MAG: T9SS type A sorting domain-containing protein [Candidatus Zixiibacteriota bacterium]
MNCAKSYPALILLLAISCLAGSVLADRSDFLVNDDRTSSDQDHPRIAVSSDGSFVITWVDRRSGSADIFIQRFSADGAALGVNRRINDDAGTAYQAEPAIAADLAGTYTLVWKDFRDGIYPFDPRIYIQKLDTSAAPIASNSALTIELPDSLKETPDIALSPWGGGVVVWADYRNRNWDIYGQSIGSDGSRVGANFRVNDDTGTAQQHAPRVTVSPEGWFAVAWYDNRLGNDDIFVQRYDLSGGRLGVNVKVNSNTGTSRQAFPDLAADGAGHFTVVWVDWRNGVYPANPDIYARKFDTMMTPVAVESRVNQDGTQRAQREPSIAADRRGNVAMIWSDSSGTAQSYDIVGQMIDVDGVIREANFRANSLGDSAQLQADVALDGRYRYITWADKRNGHYDIFASITRYNDPTLVPTPNALRFEMLAGGELPDPQPMRIDHYGYNPLHFRVLRSHNWFQAAPSDGVTPATVTVSILADTLSYGSYLGALTLFDLDNIDSSVQVTVRLDVTAPILRLSEDTLFFRVFAGLEDSASQAVSIANVGAGHLTWHITEALDWLHAEPVSGIDDTVVSVWASGATLSSGVLFDSIQVVAEGAINSPQTIWVRVEASDNSPYIQLDPDSFYVAGERLDSLDLFTVVRNAGTGALNWAATAFGSWLQAGTLFGSDNDTVRLTVNTAALSHGLNVSRVEFADPYAFHQFVNLPVVMDYLLPGRDTIIVADLDMAAGAADSFAVQVVLHDSTQQIILPLTFDPDLVSVDGVTVDAGLADVMTVNSTVDTVLGVMGITVTGAHTGSVLAPSAVDLVWVRLTAKETTGVFEAGEAVSHRLAAVTVGPSGDRRHPSALPGLIRIDDPTSVDADPVAELPQAFTLEQNYPNPFNPSTTIVVQMPRQAVIELEVFNILGQRVSLLAGEVLPAGVHKLLWDGRFDDGREAPSGIYFYRIRAFGISLVRKMVLIK